MFVFFKCLGFCYLAVFRGLCCYIRLITHTLFRKRKPPMKVENLIDDLKDGVRLLALLEVLSGEKLPMERGRVLRRPHFLSNCNTALEFLKSKRVRSFNKYFEANLPLFIYTSGVGFRSSLLGG